MFKLISTEALEIKITELVFKAEGRFDVLSQENNEELTSLLIEFYSRRFSNVITECDLCVDDNYCPNLPF